MYKKYLINENYFDNIDSEEKAYILGLLFADGANLDSFIRLEMIDFDILDKISKILVSNYDNNSSKFIKSSIRDNRKITYYFNLNSIYMCKVLSDIGCIRNKSLVLKYPTNLKKDLNKHFIRGYFDGDGSIYFNKTKGRGHKIKITSTEDFLVEVGKIINNELKYQPPKLYHDCNKTYSLSICGNIKTKLVLDWMYLNSSIYLDRKYNKYIEIVNDFNTIKKYNKH